MTQYYLDPEPTRESAFLAVMLAGWFDLTDYISIEAHETGNLVTVEHEELAGGGARFILAAFASLYNGTAYPVALADLAALDSVRFPVFMAALNAWYGGEATS